MTFSSKYSCCKSFENLVSSLRYTLLLFVVRNRELFRYNSDVRNICTKYNSDLHLPIAHLTAFHKSFFFILELQFLTIFHQVSKIYHMM